MARSGAPVRTIFRKLDERDAPAYAAHLERLSADGRLSRFRTTRSLAVERLPPHAIVVGAFVDDALRGVGELHPATGRSVSVAEAALSVEPPWQHRGLGTALLDRVSIVGRNRGIQRLLLLIGHGNRAMLKIARKVGAHLAGHPDELWASLDLPPPNPATLTLERLDDTVALTHEAVGAFRKVAGRAAVWRPGSLPAAGPGLRRS